MNHYRCFGCGECRDDYAQNYNEPYLCEMCIEKLWQIYKKDIVDSKRTLRDFINSG